MFNYFLCLRKRNSFKTISLIFLLCFLSIYFISAELGYDNPTIPKLNAEVIKTKPVNYSSVYVNDSLYWQGHTGTDAEWMTSRWFYNMTTPFSTWLSGYLYNYNQSDGSYNVSYDYIYRSKLLTWSNPRFYQWDYSISDWDIVTDLNAILYNTYNATYHTWTNHNQTLGANIWSASQGWNSTYNSTYQTWAYNQSRVQGYDNIAMLNQTNNGNLTINGNANITNNLTAMRIMLGNNISSGMVYNGSLLVIGYIQGY